MAIRNLRPKTNAQRQMSYLNSEEIDRKSVV